MWSYRDWVYRENKPNKILLQKIEKIPKTIVLTRMQHNLICESPFMKKSVKSTWGDAGRSPRTAMRWIFPTHDWNSRPDWAIEVKFSKPWLKFPTWSSNFSSQQMSKNNDFNVIGCIATKISSFQKIFVKLGEIKFKDFFKNL